jgi:hypothetical protein
MWSWKLLQNILLSHELMSGGRGGGLGGERGDGRGGGRGGERGGERGGGLEIRPPMKRSAEGSRQSARNLRQV